MSASDLLHQLVKSAFQAGEWAAVERLLHPELRIVDGQLPEPTVDALKVFVEEFGRAFERRELVRIQSVTSGGSAMACFDIRALHVGTAWGAVPSGRPIELRLCTEVSVDGGRVVSWSNLWSTRGLLLEFGVVAPAALDAPSRPPRPEPGRLLGGDPGRTRWARSWGLPPFLSRTAVLLMAGFDAREMARALGVTPATVRTYIKVLYRDTGIHGRLALLRAAALAASPALPPPSRTSADWEAVEAWADG